MIADVAVSNDKVSIELLPTRDADAANEDGDEKVNLAMAFQRVQVKGERYFLNNRRLHLSEKNRKVKTKIYISLCSHIAPFSTSALKRHLFVMLQIQEAPSKRGLE